MFSFTKRTILTLATGAALVSAGCSSDTSNSSETTGESEPRSEQPGVGDDVEGHGVTLRIDDAYETTSLALSSEERSVRDGAKFTIIETTVTNDGPEDIDLSCGTGLLTEVTATPEAEYRPIDTLHLLPGNPTCGESLTPEDQTEMTWAFEVPDDRTAVSFGFTNPDVDRDRLTYVRLGELEERSPEPAPGPSPTLSPNPNLNPDPSPEAGGPEITTDAPPAPAEVDVPEAAAPAYGEACSESQILQPTTGVDGTTLVCVGMGGAGGPTWVYGPEGQGTGTAAEGAACTEGEEGGQDAAGRMMMCMNGEWFYGP